MATYNALRLNKNDQKKRNTALSFIIPAGTTAEQLKAGLLLGYTQEKSVVTSIAAYNITTGNSVDINAIATGGTDKDLKIGNAAAATKFYAAVQPIVFRANGATEATSADVVIAINLLEVFNTDGYLVGPNTANLRAPLDDNGEACIEFPDIAPNTRAF